MSFFDRNNIGHFRQFTLLDIQWDLALAWAYVVLQGLLYGLLCWGGARVLAHYSVAYMTRPGWLHDEWLLAILYFFAMCPVSTLLRRKP